MQQLGIIKSFIDDRAPPSKEPVFIAGDLNVDKYDVSEYAAMLRILKAWDPRPLGHPYTVDSTINGRAGYRLYLDYVLVSNGHLRPLKATVETLIPRSQMLFGTDPDLSDHFPVLGHFMFPFSSATIAVTGD